MKPLLILHIISVQMKLTPSELESNGYQEKGKFHYNELTTFIGTYFAKANAATVFFVVFNIVLFAVLTIKVALVAKSKTHGLMYTSYFLGGFLLLALLIPVHEVIHAIAYKLCGAKKVSFTVVLKKFVFLTVADKFVASKSEFLKVLLAPFILITISLVLLFFFSDAYLQCSIVVALVTHTFACSGDFALVSYFLAHKEEIVTFDDAKEEMVYFYAR